MAVVVVFPAQTVAAAQSHFETHTIHTLTHIITHALRDDNDDDDGTKLAPHMSAIIYHYLSDIRARPPVCVCSPRVYLSELFLFRFFFLHILRRTAWKDIFFTAFFFSSFFFFYLFNFFSVRVEIASSINENDGDAKCVRSVENVKKLFFEIIYNLIIMMLRYDVYMCCVFALIMREHMRFNFCLF